MKTSRSFALAAGLVHILLSSLFSCLSRSDPKEAPMDIRDDALLASAVAGLPAGWEARIEEGRLLVERRESAWILLENKINAPFLRESPEERAARIRAHGKLLKPRFAYAMGPRALESGALLSSRRSLVEAEVLGLDDDLHSVEPEAVSAELWEAKAAFEASLALVVGSLEELEVAEGRLVAAWLERSDAIPQGRMASPAGFNQTAYVDLGGRTTVLYSERALEGDGPWFVVGRALVLAAEAPDPRRKETVREVHLAARSVEDLPLR